jgi:hypothetical protein
MLPTPLAYKYVVIAAMMSQINYYGPRLHLPIDLPAKESDIRFLHVSPPVVGKGFQDIGGRIQVKNFSFTFAADWIAIYNIDAQGKQSLGIEMSPGESGRSGLERASMMKYTINTNDAYRIATNWISGLDVDLAKLESIYRPVVTQETFNSKRGPVPSPLISVEWKPSGYSPHSVTIQLSAVNGELLQLVDGNGPYQQAKEPLIRDLDKLLAISDAEFLKYDKQQRNALVARFAPVMGSTSNFPAAILDSLFKQ